MAKIKLLLISLFFLASTADASYFHPKTTSDYSKVTVRIFDKAKRGGGTGSIYRSSEKDTQILTNKHVCRLVEQGGWVEYDKRFIPVSHYKKFKHHDLCLVNIKKDLKYNLKLADRIPVRGHRSVVTGHPNLLPNINSLGHFSDRMDIELVEGLKECTDEDMKRDPAKCIFMGGIPIFKIFDSQLISNLIMPGSSGSPVFNRKGELAGVVFAGKGRDLSYGFIVPHEYLVFFLKSQHLYDWVEVGTSVNNDGFSDRHFDFRKCDEVMLETDKKYKHIKQLCAKLNDRLIWSK